MASECRAYLNAPQTTAARGGITSSLSFPCPFHPAETQACFELRRVDFEGPFQSSLDTGHAFLSHGPSSVEAPLPHPKQFDLPVRRSYPPVSPISASTDNEAS